MAKKPVTAEAILRELQRISDRGNAYSSRQAGKKFYEPLALAKLLRTYLSQAGKRPRDYRNVFGMSEASLNRILDGGNISENMLYRLQTAFQAEIRDKQRRAAFPGDWRKATSADVSDAISAVSEKLLFLKKVIETSNHLNSPESPIDKIQVAQLMALLVSTLEALKAPFVDRKQTRGFFRWLGKLGLRGAEKQIESRVSEAISDAVDAGTELVKALGQQVDVTDLGDIINL